MMQDTITGVFDYLDKEYPFVLHDRVLKIAQTPFQYNTDFEGITDIDHIQGVTSNNKDIVFFGCKVYCSERLFLSTEIAITIQGYILLRNSQTDYDRIDFYSPAINGFYSPRNAYTVETKEQFVATGITLREKDTYRKTFNCKINGEELQIGLDIYVSLNLNFTEEKLGTARSVFYMAFQSKKRLRIFLDTTFISEIFWHSSISEMIFPLTRCNYSLAMSQVNMSLGEKL